MKEFLVLVLGLVLMLSIVFGIAYSIVCHNWVIGLISLTILVTISIIECKENDNIPF